MPEVATWLLVFVAPAVAGAVALKINSLRLEHERQLARFEALRKLFGEGGELLTAAMSDRDALEAPAHLVREFPGIGPVAGAIRLQMFRSRLLLWFSPTHDVVKTWGVATEDAALYLALSSKVAQPQTASGGSPLEEAQKVDEKAADEWLRVAREHLEITDPR